MGTETLIPDNLLKKIAVFTPHGRKCIPIKVKFGMEVYTMGSRSHANLGPSCEFRGGSAPWLVFMVSNLLPAECLPGT